MLKKNVKIMELNELLDARSDIRYAFDINMDTEYDEETDEVIYPDNYWDEYEIQDYINSLGEYNSQSDDRIDSIICKNVKDNMDFGGKPCNNYIVFDENRIKIYCGIPFFQVPFPIFLIFSFLH